MSANYQVGAVSVVIIQRWQTAIKQAREDFQLRSHGSVGKYNQSYILAVEDKNEVFPALLGDFHLDFFR